MYIHAQRDVSDGLVVVIGSARACCTKGAWQDGRGGRGAFLYKHDGSSIENDDSSIENDDSSIENDDSSLENHDVCDSAASPYREPSI